MRERGWGGSGGCCHEKASTLGGGGWRCTVISALCG